MYVCQYCGKQFNTKQQLGGHIIWCKENPNRSGKSNFIKRLTNTNVSEFNQARDDLFCQYCGKQCKSINSLKQHEYRCNKNPNSVKCNGGFNNYNKRLHSGEINSWNKGLTKNTDERVKQQSITYKQRYAEGLIIHVPCTHTLEFKNKQSKRAYDRKLGGHSPSKHIFYNNVLLESTYEYKLAKALTENNVIWIRPKPIIWIDNNGKKHRYYPDFYLPEYDVYLDPKNDYLINNVNKRIGLTDTEKIHKVSEQNNIKIFILTKNELEWNIVAKKIGLI